MEDKLFIEKLSGPENWATWKFQIEHFLKAKGLWSMVMETDTVAADANAQTRAEFQKPKEIFCASAECKYTPIVPNNKLSDSKRSVGHAKRTL